jgi:hypothetical protein
LTNRPVFAIVAVIVSVSSLAGCGGSSAAPDGAATGTGGKKDGGATDVAGTTGGSTGAGGTTGSGGGGAGGASVTPADVGKTCAADADCTGGLICLTAGGNFVVDAEGPAHGMCSKSCSADGDCGSAGICLRVSADAATTDVDYCFQTCTFGGTAAKCHGRSDVACATIDFGTTPTTDACLPICSQDSDCPTGRKCNLADGLCTNIPPTGDPLGTHCIANPDTGASSCAAFCLPVGSSATTVVASFCSMACVVGNLNACNWVGAGSPLTTGGTHGACGLSSATAQPGDLGFCTQECDTAANCNDQTDTGLTCDTQGMATIGHGLCSWG